MKCGSRSVYRSRHDVLGYERGRMGVPLSFFAAANVHEYICTECGYIESYLADREDGAKVAKHCTKVVPCREGGRDA